MLHIDDIFDYAKAKGLKVDYFSECFTLKNRWDDEIEQVYIPETYIGLQVNSYTWFWWKFDAKMENAYMFFHQRYNAGSGHSIKAWRTGFNMEYKIREFLMNYNFPS